ncbi:MAG: HIT family protein [Parcubacteria group bacterium]|nr:HIT family protein [Parcubacteria group bacterium]
MSDCLFCKIIAGEIPSVNVYEDEYVLAFLDINPVKAGHTLVVPKNHADDVSQSSNEDLAQVMGVVLKIAPKIQETVGGDGFNLMSNVGEAAGQSVFHTHFHIIPRFNGDGLPMWEHEGATDEGREALGEKIRNALIHQSDTLPPEPVEGASYEKMEENKYRSN